MIFDVGANHGQSLVMFRRWYDSATIHCFEPVPATFDDLSSRVGRWPRVHLHRIGLGARPEEARITVGADDTRAHVSTDHSESGEAILIETVDRFCERHRLSTIDYLKIDTEGHDLAVLQGADRLLGNGAVAIVEVEAAMNPDNRFHVSFEALAGQLTSNGYRLFGLYEQVLEWPTADAYLRRANVLFVSPDTIRRNHYKNETLGATRITSSKC